LIDRMLLLGLKSSPVSANALRAETPVRHETDKAEV
jgi:hypothetical protein